MSTYNMFSSRNKKTTNTFDSLKVYPYLSTLQGSYECHMKQFYTNMQKQKVNGKKHYLAQHF